MALSLYHGAPQLSVPARSYARIPQVLDMPHLVEMQTNSFRWFLAEALRELFAEISPIQDFTGAKYELSFLEHEFRDPKYSLQECRDKEITYSAPLYVKTQLKLKEKSDETKEQWIFAGDVPMMTPNGTFMVNGAERVVVSQLVRSPGVYFTTERDPASDRELCYAKLIPYRGAWLEFETSTKDIVSVKVDRKRKVSATTFLTALGMASEEDVMAPFKGVDTDETHKYMQTTLEKDPLSDEWDHTFKEDGLKTVWEALRRGQPYDRALALRIARAQLEFYRRLRPGEPPSLENSWALIRTLFFEPRRYDLGRVGRYKLNRRLGLEKDGALGLLDNQDLIAVLSTIIKINNGLIQPDDIDHLGNRRVRAVGELMQNQLRVGLLRMERMVRERMTLVDPEQATPQALVNIRPVVAAIREFFGGSQLSQFMDQTNPLAELTHKRRLSALGPGGLSRERAGFEVRDVHYSHYGRICPIETPEGPNIGLLSSLATYARINPFGFIESPYRKVYRELNNNDPDLVGRTLTKDIKRASGEVVAAEGIVVTSEMFGVVSKLSRRKVSVKHFVSQKAADIAYLSADAEDKYIIAQANVALDEKNQFTQDRVEVRVAADPDLRAPEQVDYLDVSPMQIVSVSASLIPFLEHDDANRALMGSNMQRQAVPLLRAQAPLVGTGIEGRVALDSGQVVVANEAGIISSATGEEVRLLGDSGVEHKYKLTKFARTNQGTCFNQRSIVEKGERVKAGAVLADSSSTDHGRLALGQNVVVAFMCWEGYNFEDAIVISEALIQKDYFTSIHVEKYDMEARETKLGPEEITRDIPNVGEESLRDLDERGIIRKGAEVGPGDILVGKVTPKGETELTAEEKLLRAIFGEKSRDVKDTSLRVPHGERGKVIDVKILSKDNKDELPPGVNESVRVWVAQTRKLSVGDKMAGRHGNKGVVSRILPVEDMPFLPDGRQVDIILNPIGVPSRMNLGQVLETHLGWSARFFNFDAVTPVFDGAKDVAIEDGLARVWFVQQAHALTPADDGDTYEIDLEKAKAWLNERGYNGDHLFNEKAPSGEARTACLKLWLAEQGVDTAKMAYEEMLQEALRLHREKRLAPPTFGKIVLRDGRTGEPFEQPITVGYIYMMKLIHLVEDKIHARSTGPYSLITQQPLGGKAQFGGQRFGEMEVWALEAYSAAYNLQEMLTVKADDVSGRVKTYESIVKGEDVVQPGLPESFNVLLKELQSLGLAVELLNEEEDRVILDEEDREPAVVEGLAQPAEAGVLTFAAPAPEGTTAAPLTDEQPSAEAATTGPEAPAEPESSHEQESQPDTEPHETR